MQTETENYLLLADGIHTLLLKQSITSDIWTLKPVHTNSDVTKLYTCVQYLAQMQNLGLDTSLDI